MVAKQNLKKKHTDTRNKLGKVNYRTQSGLYNLKNDEKKTEAIGCRTWCCLQNTSSVHLQFIKFKYEWRNKKRNQKPIVVREENNKNLMRTVHNCGIFWLLS